MAAIQYTDRRGPNSQALTLAVLAALQAPSILNTQPWHWRVDGDVAELHADRARQLGVIDPDGRLLPLSCGSALHHAVVALAADGGAVEVTRFPAGESADLLATLRFTGSAGRTPQVERLRRAMSLRRTDRRPFADLPVPEDALERLGAAAREAGANLHLVRPHELVDVIVAAGHAADVEEADPAYRAELSTWAGGADAITVEPGPRPVPIRNFSGTAPSVYAGQDVADRSARYAVLYTAGDTRPDWLLSGEALSTVLLTATAEGLAVSPMSDLVEVAAARALLRRMLGDVGYPAIVLRIGRPGRAGTVPEPPRRPVADVVTPA